MQKSHFFSLYSYITVMITLAFFILKWCSSSTLAAATRKNIFQNTFQCLLSHHMIMYWKYRGRGLFDKNSSSGWWCLLARGYLFYRHIMWDLLFNILYTKKYQKTLKKIKRQKDKKINEHCSGINKFISQFTHKDNKATMLKS